MAKCKSCGAEIIWLVMESGKKMPCDAQKIPCRENVNGKYILVLPSGKLIRADIDLDSDVYGYTSHFATCPAANDFRKER